MSIHPAISSFPLAFLVGAACLQLLGSMVRDPSRKTRLKGGADYLCYLGLIAAVLTFFTGFDAADQAIKKELMEFDPPPGVIESHYTAARCFLVAYVVMVVVRTVSAIATVQKTFWWALSHLLFLAVLAGGVYVGQLGGKMVFEHGVGIRQVK